MPVPRFIVVPKYFLFSEKALKNPFTVSSTNVKSLRVSTFPKLIFFLKIYCNIIVGMTALKDCLGPNVLKGRIIIKGNLYEK